MEVVKEVVAVAARCVTLQAARWGAAITGTQHSPTERSPYLFSTSLDCEQTSSLLLRRQQLSIHTTIIPTAQRALIEPLGLQATLRTLPHNRSQQAKSGSRCERLGYQDLRSSKHNYSVGKARSCVAVPTYTQIS